MQIRARTSEYEQQWSPGAFTLISVLYIVLTFHVLILSIRRFEASSNSDLWDARVSFLNIVVAIVFISISLSTKDIQLNMAFFWVFQYVFFGLGGLLSQIDPYPYYLVRTSSVSFLINASEIVFLAQIFVGFGQLLRMKKKRESQGISWNLTDAQVSILQRRNILLLKIYMVGAPIVISQLGGFSFLFNRVRISNLETNLAVSVNAILQTLLYVPPVIAILILLFLEKLQVRYRFIKIGLLLWILFLSNPFANARQTTLFLILPLIFLFLKGRTRAAILFFTALPLSFVYSAGIVNRYTGILQAPRLSILSRDGDFDAFSQVANGLQVVSQGEFDLFRQILASIFFFVPRSIYVGKPSDTGVELARILGLKFQNLSAPWILESYVNGRIFGVILVSLLLGFYLSKLDLESNSDIRYFLLASLASGFLFIVLRGSLLQATGRASFSVVLMLVMLRGVRLKEISTN